MVAMEGCGAVVKRGRGGKQRDQSVGKGVMETTQIKEEGAGTRRGEQRDKTEMVTGHRPLPTPKLPHHGGAGQTPTCTLGPLPTDGRPLSLLPRSVAPSHIHNNPHQAQPTPPPLGCVTAQRLQCTGQGSGGRGRVSSTDVELHKPR